ncbi:translation initiation factor IF-2-like [Panthera leo]|uniref:translation initiation factor IF-2-like n=1 Tax=Panthera leo TaxID=9689 RepID=UPI001C696D59|nr:translation initiation factor IF-2-like [Panthera leo]
MGAGQASLRRPKGIDDTRQAPRLELTLSLQGGGEKHASFKGQAAAAASSRPVAAPRAAWALGPPGPGVRGSSSRDKARPARGAVRRSGSSTPPPPGVESRALLLPSFRIRPDPLGPEAVAAPAFPAAPSPAAPPPSRRGQFRRARPPRLQASEGSSRPRVCAWAVPACDSFIRSFKMCSVLSGEQTAGAAPGAASPDGRSSEQTPIPGEPTGRGPRRVTGTGEVAGGILEVFRRAYGRAR